MASTAASADTAPAAPSVWPTMLLLLLTARRSAWSPNAARIAFVSVASFSGVEVPWATTYSHLLHLELRVAHGALHGQRGAVARRVRAR